jgi:hypothetical protein
MQPVSPFLTLPPDADALMAEAQARPGLLPDSFRHASDAIIAKQSDGKFVHQTHRNLRKRVAAKKAAAALGA